VSGDSVGRGASPRAVERLAQIRASRDAAAVAAALDAITECARTNEGNLLDLAVKASRPRPPPPA